jgi:thiamine biosynthesis lipoprotein
LCLGQKEGANIAKKENLEVFFIENKAGKLVNSSSQTLADSPRVTFESDKK